MKKTTLFYAIALSGALTACGDASDSGPSAPNLCADLGLTECNAFSGSGGGDSTSSAASATPIQAHVTNTLLPIHEDFSTVDAINFFTSGYKALTSVNPEDLDNAFYFPTSGLDSGRMAVADNKLTIGNARFTLGQTKPEGANKEGSTSQTNENAWGEFDLTEPWKISFCVVNTSKESESVNNQLFQVYLDNNTSTAVASIHDSKSLVTNPNIVTSFVPGQRVSISVPGNIETNGNIIGSIVLNPGTKGSFIQLRVPSGASLTMSDLWLGYQSDTSSEPSSATCVAGDRVASWNIKPAPAEPTSAPTLTAGDSSLSVNWEPIARADKYNIVYNTVDSLEGENAKTVVVNGTEQTTTIANLVNGTTYYVFIQAENLTKPTDGVVQKSQFSPSASGAPEVPSTPPAVPSAIDVIGADAQILVQWGAAARASSYTLAYNTTNSVEGATVITGITEQRYLISGLNNASTYYVFIKSVNSVGESTYSESTNAVPVASSWTTSALDLFGEASVSEPSGIVTEANGEVVLRATGGVITSGDAFKTVFANRYVEGPFTFTARLKSVDAAPGTVFSAPGNSYGFGIMVLESLTANPAGTTYADTVPRFTTVNLFTATTDPTFTGSRSRKVDSLTGSRSRSNITDVTVGDYMRIEVYTEANGGKRFKRYTSKDGITFTQQNSTTWSGADIPDNWYVGLYAAPGAENLVVTFDSVTIEPYLVDVPSSASSTSSDSTTSSDGTASSASSDTGSSSVDSTSSVASEGSSSSAASVTFPPEMPTVAPETATWNLYNGDVIPSAVGSVVTAAGPAMEFAEADTNNNWTATDGIATFSTAGQMVNSRYRLSNVFSGTYPTTYTLLSRMRNTDATNRGIEIDQSFGGVDAGRIKLILRENNVRIEKYNGTDNLDYATDFDATAWHTYQLVVHLTAPKTAITSLFIDGQEVIADAYTETLLDTGDNENRLQIGDGGSSEYTAEVDWLIWTTDDVYSPTQLQGNLPAGLGDITGYEAASASPLAWNIFDGSADPFSAGALTLADNSTVEFTKSNAAPDDTVNFFTANGDGTVSYNTVPTAGADQRLYARYGFAALTDPLPIAFTAVMRVQGNGTNRALEVDSVLSDGTNGARIKMLLRADGSNQGAQLEKIDGTNSINGYNSEAVYSDYRIYQLSVVLESKDATTGAFSGTVNIYENAVATPIATYTGPMTTTATSSSYIRFGEGSSSDYAANIDWLIWSPSGAYSPSDLTGKIPASVGVITGY